MALIRDKTENGLHSDGKGMHAIDSSYALHFRCERTLGAVPTPPKGTQHESESYP